MNMLFIDLETTGLDTDGCQILEVGATLWDSTNQEILAVLSEYNSDVIEEDFSPEDQEIIFNITGIRLENVLKYGIPFHKIMKTILSWDFDRIAAHNGECFDRLILKRVCKEHSIKGRKRLFKKNWIDSMVDVPFPKNMPKRSLMALAAYHKMVNYWPHRALPDVLIMVSIFCHYDIEEIVENSRSPFVHIRQPKGPFDKALNEVVKAEGFKFGWYGEKTWDLKTRKRLTKPLDEYPFNVVYVED